jgi:hypothetical protein
MPSVLEPMRRPLRRMLPPRWLILTLLVIGIEVVYAFIISAGTFTDWPTWNSNYDLQAQGFRSGHLYIPVEPAPELLAKANPLDPANESLWFWDATLHGGHYYLYWGPLPALLLTAYKIVFHVRKPIGDQYLLFLFYSLYVVAGTLLIDRLAKRLFEHTPLWLVILAVLVFALGNPTPFMVATPGIYEAAIAGGQAFLVLGTLFACDAVFRREAGAYSRRRQILAGIAFALGLATRISIGPPVALIALWTALSLRHGKNRASWRGVLAALFRMAMPVALVTAALLAYNKARFDAWLDFGTRTQLSTMRLHIASEYVLPNLWSYLLRPLAVTCEFPFVAVLPSEQGFPAWLHLPPGYWTPEPLAGLLPASPAAWLIPVALVLAGHLLWSRWRGRKVEDQRPALAAQQRTTLWFLASALTLALVTALPIAGQFLATMRYTADASAGVALLIIWGGWSLYRHAGERPYPRRAVTLVLVSLAAGTVVIGLLLGTQGYDDILRNRNPALFETLRRVLSRCG